MNVTPGRGALCHEFGETVDFFRGNLKKTLIFMFGCTDRIAHTLMNLPK